jgi:calcium-dependent protein kinase
VKTISRECINSEVELIDNELDILLKVDHPNILNFYEIFMDENHFHFVMQLCEGGTVNNFIQFSKRISEHKVANIAS